MHSTGNEFLFLSDLKANILHQNSFLNRVSSSGDSKGRKILILREATLLSLDLTDRVVTIKVRQHHFLLSHDASGPAKVPGWPV
jgi:hypothetical protein